MRPLSSLRNSSLNRPVAARAAAGILWLAAGCAPVLLPPAVACAQTVEAIPSYVGVVTRDGTSMQCRLGSASYPVKSLSNGQLLKVLGQAGSWYQVEYPAGMSAFVKLDDASPIEGGKAVKLTRNSRLMAANADGGVNWWYLLDKDLPAGTTFSVTKTVKGSDGKDTGYLVPAPKGAYGFVRKDVIRQASQSEIDAANPSAKPDVKPELKPATPEKAPVTPAPIPTPTPATPDKTPANAATPNPIPAPNTPTSTTPANPPANPPVNPPAAPPTGTTPDATPTPANPPATTPNDAATPANPPVAPVVPARPKVDAEALSGLYQYAMTRPEGEVEIGAIIGEYQKALNQLEERPDTERLRRQLSTRMEALKLRSELLETLKQSDERLASLRTKSASMNDQLSKLERERQFAVVGRLLASSVYDGRKLPLMYRVTSPDATAPRTLAYVTPTQAIILSDRLGEMVGVAGDKKYDEDLKVNVITPTRVETVTTPVIEPAPAPAPAPTGTAPSVPTPDGLRTEVPIKPAPNQNK